VTCTESTGIAGIAKVLECVPDGMEGKTGTPAALVVALHGYTQTAEEFKNTTEWHVLAGRYHFYLAFPQTNADLVNAGGRPAAWKWWRFLGVDARASTRTTSRSRRRRRMKAAHDRSGSRVPRRLVGGRLHDVAMLACFSGRVRGGSRVLGWPAQLRSEVIKQRDARPPGACADRRGRQGHSAYWNDATSASRS
jgi:hypothetical protein